MAVLEKIRVKFGLAISIIIALALLSFLIDPGTLESALQSMSAKYDVGKIAGKSISYNDFQADVDNYTTINQILTGTTTQGEKEQESIRDAAWQGLLDKYLFIKNAKAAGLKVGEQELVELTSGSNVSPLIAQNPAFQDENGMFSREALLQFVGSVNDDESGQLRTYWNYLQNNIYTQQYYTKYGSLFTSGNFENALMLQNELKENNTTADVEYVMAMYPFAKDSSIVVSSNEIKNYYDAHKKMFKQVASRDAEYVVFEVVPSDSDIAAAGEDIAAVYDEFTTSDNMKAFLLKNSERSLSEYWYRAGELSSVSSKVSEFVDANAAGAVSPVMQEGNTFYAVKVLSSEMIPEDITVRVISAAGATAPTDSLITALRLAETMNMTQTYLLPGCEVLFTAALNQPQIIKTTQYGNILAEVVAKGESVQKKQVAILEKTALAGKETFNNYYSQANKFATLTAGTYEGYKKAVDSTKVYSHNMNVTEATANYGAIENAKEVTRWIFDHKAGKASEIITVNQNYFFVVAVKGINKEGFAPVSKVSAQIENVLYSQKLQEAQKASVAAKVAGKTSLEDVADALNAQVETRSGISFSSMGAAAVEPALLGAVYAAPENQLCGPVAGQMGVYYFKVTNREEGSFYTEEDAKNMNLQKTQYNSQMVLPVMMEDADVKDNRARFF